MRGIKLRIGSMIVILGILIITIIISIKGEVSKINNASQDYKEKLIRFHVLANSDSDEDQALKLKVRDEVIKYLQPKLLESKSIKESEDIIKNNYENLENISKSIIDKNGYKYDVKVSLGYSEFPTKQYSSVVLPAGEYKALRVVIGEGKGKNWWCVMFPPLCFVDESNGVIDKSTDDKLKAVLTEEEYDLITKKRESELGKTQIKFKIVEILDKMFEKNKQGDII